MKIKLSTTEFLQYFTKNRHLSTQRESAILPNLGTWLHQFVEAKRSKEIKGYESEKWIQHIFKRGGVEISISGKIDGFYREGSDFFVEEIKTCKNVKKINNFLDEYPNHDYILQLKIYGLLTWLKFGGDVKLNLLLFSIAKRKIHFKPVEFRVSEFECEVESALLNIIADFKKVKENSSRRKEIASKIKFPYSRMNDCQKHIDSYLTRELDGESDFIYFQAGTGVGKTSVSLVKALRHAYKNGQQVVVCTARNSQYHSFINDLQKIAMESEIEIYVHVMYAKSRLCLNDSINCNYQHCEYSRLYHQKLDANEYTIEEERNGCVETESLKILGQKYGICPYYLMRHKVQYADVIICDYNQVFAPSGCLSTEFLKKYKSKPILLVDEAHNLIERNIEYYSASIDLESIDFVCQYLGEMGFRSAAKEIEADAVEIICYCSREQRPMVDLLEPFETLLNDCTALLSDLYIVDDEMDLANPFMKFFLDVRHITNLIELFPLNVTYYASKTSFNAICFDPAPALKEIYERYDKTIFMSATLKPIEYHVTLGGTKDSHTFEEFSRNTKATQLKVVNYFAFDTRYKYRMQSIPKIVDNIRQVVNSVEGSYLVYFPSYSFLHQVYDRLSSQIEILIQPRAATQFDIAKIMADFNSSKSIVLFAVQGGGLSEGVNIPSNNIKGCIIVGPGIPKYGIRQEVLRRQYDRKFGKGFYYAYTVPGAIKAIQSAGRMIRSHDDKGIIYLLGKRFRSEEFKNIYPSDWEGIYQECEEFSTSQDLVKNFWDII